MRDAILLGQRPGIPRVTRPNVSASHWPLAVPGRVTPTDGPAMRDAGYRRRRPRAVSAAVGPLLPGLGRSPHGHDT